jgi:hypothetical protein
MFNLVEILGIVLFWVLLYFGHSRLSKNRNQNSEPVTSFTKKTKKAALDICFLSCSFLILFLSLIQDTKSVADATGFVDLQIIGFGFLCLIVSILAIVRRQGV